MLESKFPYEMFKLVRESCTKTIKIEKFLG